MNKLTLVFIALLLSACAPAQQQNLNVESSFQPFVDAFVKKSQQEGNPQSITNLAIQIDNTMAGPTTGSWTLAVCYSGGGSQPTIKVNPYFWNNKGYGNAEREELLFHEMGHCVLNRGHDSSMIRTVDGYSVDKTIMNPYHMGATRYGNSYNYYMQELFGVPVTNVASWYGSTQWTNVYASVAASVGASSVKVYKVTANADGTLSHDDSDDQDVEPGTLTIEGMGCGEDAK